jgi:hypothetical protein
LFGDGEEERGVDVRGLVGKGARERIRARLGVQGRTLASAPSHRGQAENDEAEVEWGVGLGLGLSDRQRWPPGGAELNLALRSTMASSLSELVEEKSREGGRMRHNEAGGGGVSDEREFWEGVEKRVGFSVRDLDEGEEGTEWLNPQSVQYVDIFPLLI